MEGYSFPFLLYKPVKTPSIDNRELPLKIPIKYTAYYDIDITKTEKNNLPILRYVWKKVPEMKSAALEKNPTMNFSAIDLSNSV